MTDSLRTVYDRQQSWERARLGVERGDMLEQLRVGDHAALSIAVYSTTTWRPLATFLEGELLTNLCAPEFHWIEYQAIAGDIASGKRRYDAIILAVDDVDSYGDLYRLRGDFLADERTRLIRDLLARVDRLLKRTGMLIVTLPPAAPETVFGLPSLARRRDDFVSEYRRTLDERAGVVTIDLDSVERRLGPAMLDARLWELGRIRYTAQAFSEIARTLCAPLLMRMGLGLKAVIVDLDNTLWGGVIGEDGLSGIALGEDYPGSCYRELQREIASWRRHGVLVAIASKNNPDDAFEAIDTHPEMQLRRDDFDAIECHWQPKPLSVGRILKSFNIGPEGVLFIDDNPRERRDVADAFPSLRVFDFPDDPIDILPRLRTLPWPLFAATSAEDARRGELQKQQQERVALVEASNDREDYLRSLGIHVDVAIDSVADIARVAQLHQKTNQFNVKPVRYTEADLAGWLEAANQHILTLRYRDRFGDAGLIACATVLVGGDCEVVETLLLSCRVIGLGVEQVLLNAIATLAPGSSVWVAHEETAKNRPARDFLATLALEAASERTDLYRVTSFPSWPRWIEVEGVSVRGGDVGEDESSVVSRTTA